MAADKLRILCLHGYRQSGQHFHNRLGVLRKALKDIAELGTILHAVLEQVVLTQTPSLAARVYGCHI